jgi:hypothetical protein
VLGISGAYLVSLAAALAAYPLFALLRPNRAVNT